MSAIRYTFLVFCVCYCVAALADDPIKKREAGIRYLMERAFTGICEESSIAKRQEISIQECNSRLEHSLDYCPKELAKKKVELTHQEFILQTVSMSLLCHTYMMAGEVDRAEEYLSGI